MFELLRLFLLSLIFFGGIFATVRLLYRYMGRTSHLQMRKEAGHFRDLLFARFNVSFFLIPAAIYFTLYTYSENSENGFKEHSLIFSLFVFVALSSFVFLVRTVKNK